MEVGGLECERMGDTERNEDTGLECEREGRG